MARFTIYRSSDAGAPVLTGQAGKLVDLLTGCLVNGYTASVTSITRSGSTATATAAAPHNLITGQSVTIAGAVEGGYNGTFTVTVTGATTFTYAVGGTPASPATGTITFLRIAAGWTKPLTGTNKAAFRQGAGSNGFYVRVQDDAPVSATDARVRGFKSMSDVDTGSELFPTVAQAANGLFCRKSSSADATARSWVLAADARTFYLFVLTAGADQTPTAYRAFGFGEFYSLLPADEWRCFIAARNTENSTAPSVDCLDIISGSVAATNNNWVARSYTGTGASLNINKHGDRARNSSTTTLLGEVPYPNPINGAFYLSRVWLLEPASTPVNALRGRLRGFWHWLHPIAGVADTDVLLGTGELAGKTFIVVKESGGAGLYIIETSDTIETN